MIVTYTLSKIAFGVVQWCLSSFRIRCHHTNWLWHI